MFRVDGDLRGSAERNLIAADIIDEVDLGDRPAAGNLRAQIDQRPTGLQLSGGDRIEHAAARALADRLRGNEPGGAEAVASEAEDDDFGTDIGNI